MDIDQVIQAEKEAIINEARKRFEDRVKTKVRRIQELSVELSKAKTELTEMEFIEPDVSGI